MRCKYHACMEISMESDGKVINEKENLTPEEIEEEFHDDQEKSEQEL